MIIADTGGLLALLDKDDVHHPAVQRFFSKSKRTWIVPWAVLPELDYMLRKHGGHTAALKFLNDIQSGVFVVDADIESDLPRIIEFLSAKPELGLVDAVVMAQAERHRASAIVTTDARDFRTALFDITPYPKLVPLDP